ncbi:MAG: response regulator, partial [Chloroflexi bacterium]|nr:response regulator [Chloroflexota bacterium]
TIMLYAQMPLSKSDLPPNAIRSFETILDESRRAAKLVQQILDFSRRSPIDTSPMDLKPFIEEAIHVLERTIPESIHLRFDAGPEEYVVNGDPTRIQQVLMNLVVNARDAMPEGGDLRIALSRVEVSPGDEPPVMEMAPGEWICLAISDTGTGIPPEALAHIFEPFFTTKEVGQGTGLGLAQVHGIVAQHGGHIGMETEVGQGTTFRVYLPASGAEEEIVEERALSIPQGQGETILLVEDNENLREGGRDLLESLGYRVLTGANGREALEVCRTVKETRPEPGRRTRPEQGRRIDLVITDLVMPEMGGKQLMQELGRTIPALKVLALTGYAMEESREELKEAGFLDVVYKPFEVDTLAQIVRWALDED